MSLIVILNSCENKNYKINISEYFNYFILSKNIFIYYRQATDVCHRLVVIKYFLLSFACHL